MKIMVSIVTMLWLLCLGKIQAAEITIKGAHPYETIQIAGKIEAGDFDRLVDLVKKHEVVPGIVGINSPGGDVVEAMKIGYFMRRFLIEYWHSNQCNSACVYIVFGSVQRAVNPFNGQYGLHRPFFDPDYFSGLTSLEAEKRYKELKSGLESYFHEMDVPKSLSTKIFSVPSNEVVYLSSAKMIDLIGYRSPGYDEWIISKCGALSNNEKDDLRALGNEGNHNFSQGYIEYLEKKSRALRTCELDAQTAARRELFKEL